MTQTATDRILIVEDDPSLRMMMRGMLELRGHGVTEADCRKAALDALAADSGIAVMVLDMGLPPHAHDLTEGIATLKAVVASGMPVKVIVLTGQDEEAAALAAIREGAFDFLSKPASAETILQALERALLFLKKERELSKEGVTRIAINAQIGEGLKHVRDDAEERLVRKILNETGFNVYQTSKRLGIKRESIYYFMKKFGISRDD